MTRRAGVIAAVATIAEAAQETTSSGLAYIPGPKRIEIKFGEGGFDELVVRCGKRAVTLTPKEIMDALEGR